jgi:polyphosphate kinase 2
MSKKTKDDKAKSKKDKKATTSAERILDAGGGDAQAQTVLTVLSEDRQEQLAEHVAKPKDLRKKKAKGKNKDKKAQAVLTARSKGGQDKLAEDVAKSKKLSKKEYEKELGRLHVELVKMQEWIKFKGQKVVVIFEGRDAAGKGGTIKRITESLNPRYCRVAALGTPTEREKTQWYFQRYVPHLPAAGEMVLFDRSWYNRAGVERVMGFCTEEEYQEFLRSCPEFEKMLIRSGIILIKYWFSVSDEEQERRFQARIDDPTRRWKLSPMDLQSRSKWVEYSRAKDTMFAYTDTKQSPWNVVNADDKKRARLNVITHLLSQIPYDDLTPEPIVLPPRQDDKGYVRPPMADQTFVPEVF